MYLSSSSSMNPLASLSKMLKTFFTSWGLFFVRPHSWKNFLGVNESGAGKTTTINQLKHTWNLTLAFGLDWIGFALRSKTLLEVNKVRQKLQKWMHIQVQFLMCGWDTNMLRQERRCILPWQSLSALSMASAERTDDSDMVLKKKKNSFK